MTTDIDRNTQGSATSHQGPLERPTRRRLPAGVVSGILVAIVIAVLGGLFAVSRTTQWTAETQFLVGPGPGAASGDVPAYYETLSRGQVVATAADIASQPRFQAAAVKAVGLRDAQVVSARVTVVPETALVRVTVTAPTNATAERFADALVRQSTPTVSRLLAPYAARPLGSAAGTGQMSGLSISQYAAVIALLAVVAGIGVQQVVQQLLTARRQRIR